jgi:hypothetical protein
MRAGMFWLLLKEIMEGTNQKNDECKECISIVLLVIAGIGLTPAIILQRNNCSVGYILTLLFGSIIIGVVLPFLIKHIIKANKNWSACKIRIILLSLLLNIILPISSVVFIVELGENFDKLLFLISSPIALIFILIIVYIFTNIENGDDISLLKATNYFAAFLFTAIKLIIEEKCFLNEGKGFLIEYYYLLPIIAIQGLYELFDRKSKLKNDSEPNTVPITRSRKKPRVFRIFAKVFC